jgi:hypothetical protein
VSTPLSYYLSLPGVMGVRRSIRGRADNYLERGRKLSPNGTDIPAGGAHIDELARGWALVKFLRSLSDGKTLKDSLEDGKAEASSWFKKWNESRKKEYQVYRWLHSADDTIEYAYRQVRQAIAESIKSGG